jgi:hypothetical protein
MTKLIVAIGMACITYTSEECHIAYDCSVRQTLAGYKRRLTDHSYGTEWQRNSANKRGYVQG